MRVAWAVLLPMALLASTVSYYSSTAAGPQEVALAAAPKPADPKERPGASPAAGEKADQAAVPPSTGAKTGESGAAVKPSEPPKTASAAKQSSPAPAAAPPVAEKPAVKMPPLKGSHVKDDDNNCLQCHTAETWDPKDKEQYRFFIVMDALKKDVHYKNGVNCVDCHGGDVTLLEPKAHQAKEDFRSKLPDIEKACAHCHEKEVTDLRKSDHHAAGEKRPG